MAGCMIRSFPVDRRCATNVSAVIIVETPSATQEPRATTGRTTRAMARAAWGLLGLGVLAV